jgi:hypothetical protein
MDEQIQDDPPPNQEQQSRINQLSIEEINEIEEMLLKHTCERWRKVARVVGTSMSEFKGKFKGVPDVYFSERVQSLVNRGLLESQGNLKRMRYSEIKKSAK